MTFGIVTLIWHDRGPLFSYVAAAAQILGGIAIQFRRTARAGAAVLGMTYLVFALLCVPRIIAKPQVYDSWGNFFEPFSLAIGAAIVAARASSFGSKTTALVARTLFGCCVASFALEQAVYLDATARLVPKWIPPSQQFWAIATTAFFALAAVALVTNRVPLLAARLLTSMIVGFGLLVWVPMLLSNPHSHGNWSEFADTFAIAGAAWILADVLGGRGAATSSWHK